jgi:hypothetical protein
MSKSKQKEPHQHGEAEPLAKILMLDIETFPNVGYTWGKYEQNVIRFVQESAIATYAAKWLHKPQVFAKALPDYKGYTPGSYDDRGLVEDLWKLWDEADIIVAHNGNAFDIKQVQGRFLFHGMTPPSPIKSVDTKNMVKAVARYNSNKLDDLGHNFFNERKIKTDFDLWLGCINGDVKSWRQMVTYNKKDVILLEKLYLRLRPWSNNHPNLGSYTEDVQVCPKCASSEIQYRGYAHTTTRMYRRFQCLVCGGWGRNSGSEKRTMKPLVNSL